MRKNVVLILGEVVLIFGAVVVNSIISPDPVGFSIIALVGCLVVAITLYAPEIFKWLSSRVKMSIQWARKQEIERPVESHIQKEGPSLSAWLAPDGSITLEQAAFLWLDIPVQRPVPPEVQGRIAMFQNAVNQGTLQRHKRYDQETEKNFAILRLVTGNLTPRDTRVLPSELRRWAETIEDVPEFLRSEQVSQVADAAC